MAEVKMPEGSQYPNNSITARTQPKPETPKPVVKGKATIQKEGLGKKIRKMFAPGDLREARKYVIEQYFIPGLKNGALAALEMVLFGQVTGRFGQRSGGNGNRNSATNYSYISSTGARINNYPTSVPRNQRESFSFQNISFETYDDARDVVESMVDILDRTGEVTVGQFYSLCGLGTEYPDFDWGWTKFTRLEPRRVRDDYVIDVQPPIYLRRS